MLFDYISNLVRAFVFNTLTFTDTLAPSPRHDRTPTLPSPAPAKQNPTTTRAKRTMGGWDAKARVVGTRKVCSAAASLHPL
jgi:hypothetical protein